MCRLGQRNMLQTAYRQIGTAENAANGVYAGRGSGICYSWRMGGSPGRGKISLSGEPLFSGFFMLSDETCRSQDEARQDRQDAEDRIVNLISHKDALRAEIEQALGIP